MDGCTLEVAPFHLFYQAFNEGMTSMITIPLLLICLYHCGMWAS